MPMLSMSAVIGQYWNWISYQSLEPAMSLTQPKMSLTFADGGSVFQPLVQVQCSVQHSRKTQPGLTLPNNQLVSTPPDAYRDLKWPIPSNYSAVDISNIRNNMYWKRLAVDKYQNAPSSALLFALCDAQESKVFIPCSLIAHWVPSGLTAYPKTDRSIETNFSNPLDILNRSDIDLSPSNQIQFSDEWWETLLYDATPIEDMIAGLNAGVSDDGHALYYGGWQGLAYRISTMMSMFFADAIARYSHDGTDIVAVQDYDNGSKPVAYDIVAITSQYGQTWSNWLLPEEGNQYAWRELQLSWRRYGYAWSFSGLLSKFAAIALVVQILLALGHIVVILSSRWSSNALDSIGSMIALALRSRSPIPPPDRKTGDEIKETWAETVSMRVVENDLELIFHPTRVETIRLTRR